MTLRIHARILWGVSLNPPQYTIAIPYAERPTESVKLTVPIKARVTTRFEAGKAALREMQALSDAELSALVAAQLQPNAHG